MPEETAVIPRTAEGIEVIKKPEPPRHTAPPRVKKAIPALSPLLAPAVCCQQCGNILQPKVVKGATAVQHVLYECINEEYGCRYQVESTAMLSGESKMLRPDGTRSSL